MTQQIHLEFRKNIRTALADGTLVYDSPKHAATEELYHAYKGDTLQMSGSRYSFAVAEFDLKFDDKYIYTYDYQSEANWTTYTQNLTPTSYGNQPYRFEKECFFRVCVKRNNLWDIQESDIADIQNALLFTTDVPDYIEKSFFTEEINKTAETIEQTKKENNLTFCLLTDTHYTVNGTWEDTAHNIAALHEKVPFDAIIHMGDITDGVTSRKITARRAGKVLTDLKANDVPVYLINGNHDSNYFRNNREPFSFADKNEIYGNQEYYYIDFAKQKIRAIFLGNFDYTNPLRYGFLEEELTFTKQTLATIPDGYDVMIFSHDAPIAELDYWSYYIRNGEQLLAILEDYNQQENHHILGYFHGHSHADLVDGKSSFPIISVGCSKCEYFPDKKPKGAYAAPRKLGELSQELWDTVIVNKENQQLHMIRFGAGEDRTVSFAKRKNVRSQEIIEEKKNRKTKIWAHRGASGHAPENTMPAFELAYLLRADGIETDVQMTRDGQLVLTHDERIDRVSDGKGYVCDYTLEELRTFNFAKNMPAFGKVEIPTLKELLAFAKEHRMTLNLELKNSVNFYEGMEEKVLELVAEHQMQNQVIYSSFNHYSMVKVKKLNKEARTGFLYADGILHPAAYAKENGMDAIHPSLNALHYEGVVQECREKKMDVHVWTVNEETDIKRVIALGVEALITNYPERAVGMEMEGACIGGEIL